jgi:hypothetical protein
MINKKKNERFTSRASAYQVLAIYINFSHRGTLKGTREALISFINNF